MVFSSQIFLFLFLPVTLIGYALCRQTQLKNLWLLLVLDIVLPICISFFTFQALSYCIDVYRDESLVQKNIINVALYITFFPQLIAGPIVRFSTISKEIGCSTVSAVDLKKEQPGSCMVMFIYGSGYLGKKKMFKIK